MAWTTKKGDAAAVILLQLTDPDLLHLDFTWTSNHDPE